MMSTRNPEGLKAPEGISLKVSYTRAGEESYEEMLSGAFSRQVSVRHARPKNDRLTIYDGANAEAAAVILADSERHGGPEAGLVRWAQMVTERRQPEVAQGVLFAAEANNV